MRCFFALSPDEAGKAELARLRALIEPATQGLAWLPVDKIHLTLSFLGELDEGAIAASLRALAAIGAAGTGERPPAFHPAALSYFPERGKPRVLVLEAGPGDGEVALLHRRLCAALAAEARRMGIGLLDPEWPDADIAGREPLRPWKPHLSLARVRPGAAGIPLRPERRDLGDLGRGIEGTKPVFFDRMLLLESRLDRRGAIYTEIEGIVLVSPKNEGS